jgi:predicted Zn-dependent protease
VKQDLTSAPPINSSSWTSSDQPYKEVEARIKKEYAQGKSLDAISQEYKALARRRPADPVAQFAWVYATRGAAFVNNKMHDDVPPLLQVLAASDPGNAHEYTRYRFCMTADADKILPAADARRIGDRLLRYDPHDDWVRTSLIYMLCDAGQPDMALPYALEGVKQKPKDPKAHTSLALVYQNRWFVSKRRADAHKAVVEYQKYLSLAPPTDVFRKSAELLVKNIESEAAKQQ